jgi:hypothetical protein
MPQRRFDKRARKQLATTCRPDDVWKETRSDDAWVEFEPERDSRFGRSAVGGPIPQIAPAKDEPS